MRYLKILTNKIYLQKIQINKQISTFNQSVEKMKTGS